MYAARNRAHRSTVSRIGQHLADAGGDPAQYEQEDSTHPQRGRDERPHRRRRHPLAEREEHDAEERRERRQASGHDAAQRPADAGLVEGRGRRGGFETPRQAGLEPMDHEELARPEDDKETELRLEPRFAYQTAALLREHGEPAEHDEHDARDLLEPGQAQYPPHRAAPLLDHPTVPRDEEENVFARDVPSPQREAADVQQPAQRCGGHGATFLAASASAVMARTSDTVAPASIAMPAQTTTGIATSTRRPIARAGTPTSTTRSGARMIAICATLWRALRPTRHRTSIRREATAMYVSPATNSPTSASLATYQGCRASSAIPYHPDSQAPVATTSSP